MENRLQYRRQFLVAGRPIEALASWRTTEIRDAYLLTHPDLSVEAQFDDGRSIVLIGDIFDPASPAKSNRDILQDIVSDTRTFQDLVLHIKRYAGRYVLIHRDDAAFLLVQDPLSLREVYYSTQPNLVLCGSQPNLIARFASPEIPVTTDSARVRFYTHDMPAVPNRNSSLWVGDETYFDGVRHLLPNLYLDLHRRTTHRYWPSSALAPLPLAEAAYRASRFLQGIMQAMTERSPVMVAVTAGIDSRTLLAASRGFADRIYFFINKEAPLTDASPDIAVPREMLDRVGVPFHVHEIPREVEPAFRDVFLGNTFFASDRILTTIYNIYYKRHSHRVNILGVGEIGRAYWGEAPKKLTPYYLAYTLGFRRSAYATRQCKAWLDEVSGPARQHNVNVMTLLLWEQLLGNWGTVGNSESDIAIEEWDPYASHYLYETMLCADPAIIHGDRYAVFKEMLRRMWPELLDFPINPPARPRVKLAYVLRRMKVYDTLKRLRYWGYLHRFGREVERT